MFHTGKSQFNIEDQSNKKAAYKDIIYSLLRLFLFDYTGRVPPIRITTSKAKIAYNSGNTAITIVAPNTL